MYQISFPDLRFIVYRLRELENTITQKEPSVWHGKTRPYVHLQGFISGVLSIDDQFSQDELELSFSDAEMLFITDSLKYFLTDTDKIQTFGSDQSMQDSIRYIKEDLLPYLVKQFELQPRDNYD